ncbi:exodeoxyribonuclease VII small subunit [Methanococcoides methylutens]|uniref:Exodeoxyribonuclease VII small subunit n=1 Tax=Methanococcoides methylutens MM1 TaxID=1434104 RepID=A0A0E3SSB1_METMT|nr:exodeoxyribonuclease VII small subunit [Methanococcoides methylutens]AKB86051.1 Exodeoxyribonuclease VII small subunit [Methanococcoides methylutens MM1]
MGKGEHMGKTDNNEETCENNIEELTFEEALEELENIVEHLERGQLTLDDSIDTFEKGMKLALLCNRKIEDSEKKIEQLIERNGKLTTEPFSEME